MTPGQPAGTPPARPSAPGRVVAAPPAGSRGRFFVQPATLLCWYRDLVCRRWSYTQHRSGRRAIPAGTAVLVVRFSRETWGYPRIHGELATMGIAFAPSSVWAMLRRHRIDPAPRRSGPSWAELVHAQAKGLIACDFFSVDTVLLRLLYVLFFIELDTRLVRLAGVTTRPVSDWVTQQARKVCYDISEQATPVKFLICGRDTRFTVSFDAVFAVVGTRILKTLIWAPRAKGYDVGATPARRPLVAESAAARAMKPIEA